MAIKEDAPNWLLAAFRADGDAVRWATGPELDKNPMQRPKRLPWGVVAGGKEVHGRGRLVLFSSRQLITSDIRLGLELGQFHWTYNGSGPDGGATAGDSEALDLVRKTWRLDDEGAIRWLVDAHDLYPAGSVAKGVLLSGRRERLFSYKARGYVESDVRHVLLTGAWPWSPEWD